MLLLKLVQDGAQHVRGMVDPADGCQKFSVYDFATLTCKYHDSGARQQFSAMIREGSDHRDEVLSLTTFLKFPGRGQRETPCMTIRGLMRFMMMLGGKVAAEYREIVEGSFSRVMAGDQSLIEVINANAASNAPVQQAFRQALEQEPVVSVLDDYCLKRKRDLEDLDLLERRIAVEERQVVLERNKLELQLEKVQKSATLIQSLKTMHGIDERTRLQFEDYAKNIVLNSVPISPAITNGEAPAPNNETAALNVSVLAKELGFTCNDKQLIQIGRAMAAKYRSMYGEDPPKHKQFVNGNFVPVNSYMERDRSVMEQVIRECMHVVVQTS